MISSSTSVGVLMEIFFQLMKMERNER